MSEVFKEKLSKLFRSLRKHGVLRIVSFFFVLIQDKGLIGGGRFFIRKTMGLEKPLKKAVENSFVERTNIANLPASAANKVFKNFVLIIATLDLPQCKKYRVLQRAELIEEGLGVRCIISHYQDTHRWRMLMQLATSVIFYRVPAGEFFDQAIFEAYRLGVTVSYDIDDPVFDFDTVVSNPNFRLLDKATRNSLKQDTYTFSEAMLQCKTITVSTIGMQNLVKKRFPNLNVYIVPNGLDRETLHYASVVDLKYTNLTSREHPFSIIIPSGSHAHGADSMVMMDGLAGFIKKNSETHVIEIGHGGIGDRLGKLKSYKKYPLLAYSEYLQILPKADCILVPLASSDFNECKSIVRFLDASSVGVPVLATNIGEYREVVANGVCLGIESVDQWVDALSAFREKSKTNIVTGSEAKNYVLKNKTLKSIAKDLDPNLVRLYKVIS